MVLETQDSHQRASAVRMARAIWGRRKWIAMLAFCAPFLAVASLVVALPNLYRATATVLVKQDLISESSGRSAAGGELEPRLQMISEEILSRPRLEELIARFDLYPNLRQRAAPEAVIERMRWDLQLERKQVGQQWGRSMIVGFTLSYQGWDPQTVADVVNTLASYYVEENERLRERQVAGSKAAGSVDELTRLKRELAELRTRFSDRYPDVMRLKAQIAVLQRERDEMMRARADAQPSEQVFDFVAAEQELEALEKKNQRLEQAIAAAAASSGESVLKREQEIEKLRRERATSLERQASLSQRYNEAQRALAPAPDTGEQFRLLDPAIAPHSPIAPNRIRLIFMGLILSIAIAGGIVLLVEQLDTSFHRLEELWAFTNMPILASVPRIVTRGDAWRRGLRISVLSVLAVSGVALLTRASYVLGQSGEQVVWFLAQRGG